MQFLWKVMISERFERRSIHWMTGCWKLASLTGWLENNHWKSIRCFGLRTWGQDKEVLVVFIRTRGWYTTLGKKRMMTSPQGRSLFGSPKIAEDDKMAIVIHWSSVRGFGILRSQVHGEVPGDEWGWMRSSRKMAGLSLHVEIGSASSSSFLGACSIVTSPNLCVFQWFKNYILKCSSGEVKRVVEWL